MLGDYKYRPTWALINLGNLAENFQAAKNFVGDEIKYLAVVKADGYGHGAVECAKHLEKESIDWFGVALPEEGLKLREHQVSKPILCLGGFWDGQEKLLLGNDLTSVLFQIEKAHLLNEAAKLKNIVADIHIKIDTGMGRIGIRFDEIGNFISDLKKLSHLRVEGIMTHFASADNPKHKKFTDTQIQRFYEAVKLFEENGFQFIYKDLANSPGAIMHRNSYGNMVRLGGILYGLGNDIIPESVEKPDFKPVMSLHSRISHLKKVPKGETVGFSRTFKTKRNSLIASLPIGYHDGYNRSLSNKGKVIINGVYAPVVGRISMDWTLIDVTDVPDVKINDEAILIGEQNGLKITAEDLAKLSGTISYEITCGISERVKRIYEISPNT